MRTIAFVGPSGSGKSYRSIMVSQQYGADAIIDDGLLISHGKVIAGTSAKREATRIASVKHALFMKDEYAAEMIRAIRHSSIKCLMILGTSDEMVHKIAKRLKAEPIEHIIRIEDIATPEEIQMAHNMRNNQGKHVIPVPTFEIKKDFSGYFLHPLRLFQKNKNTEIDSAEADKSIVRPTFSYMGDYIISDNALKSIAVHEGSKIKGIHRITYVNIRKTGHGAHIDIECIVNYGADIERVCTAVQLAVKRNIEKFTSVNVRRVHILVKGLNIPR
ncbi:MAG: Asp23/Gls24 family envelope stress response protein [Clostridiales bacterium]|nr:Asp23/Gls24 family envelope stress response protein [Clostridiales bacterium]